MYVVLQSIPLIAVDAPGLRHTEGVEYFLCMPPQGNLPWLEDAGEVRKMLYQVAGGDKMVELAADVVMFSVEATYHRSHCWLAAKQWEGGVDGGAGYHAAHGNPVAAPVMSPLEPPRAVFSDEDPVMSPSSLQGSGSSPPPGSPAQLPLRGRSPGRASGHRPSSIAFLEPVNLGDIDPRHQTRRSSQGPRHSASATNLSSLAAGGPTPPRRVSPSGHPVQQQKHGQRQASLASTATTSTGGSGSTFDTILQGIDNQKGPVKKRSSFLPF